VISNDVVCLAIAPLLAIACRERRLDPLQILSIPRAGGRLLSDAAHRAIIIR